ncbi:MAG TPA: hypothetical protein VG122_09980, partial [Gemmata sp.]|nr:hypothetical protein [Gemmata sp.]
MLTAIGMGFGAKAEQVALESASFFPACLIGLLAIIFDLCGFGGLFLFGGKAICEIASALVPDGRLILSVSQERISIHEESEYLPKATVIACSDIVWVNPEVVARGKRVIRVVHNPQLKTKYVYDIKEADFDRLLGILKERCQPAFTTDPPAGYVPTSFPQTEQPPHSFAAEQKSLRVFQYGPKVYRDFVHSSLVCLVGIVLAGICYFSALVVSIQGAFHAALGSGAFLFGIGFTFLILKSRWMDLAKRLLQDQRRDELHLTNQGLILPHFLFKDEPRRIAFEGIQAIRCESFPEAIVIVGNTVNETLTIPRSWMAEADYQALLDSFKQLKPEVFKAPFHRFSFGPARGHRALSTSFVVIPPILIMAVGLWLMIESLMWGGWWTVLAVYCGLVVLNGVLWMVMTV